MNENIPKNEKAFIETIKELEASGMEQQVRNLLAKYGPHLSYSPRTEEWLGKFITQDKDMMELKRKVIKLIPIKWNHISVLIQGETGTGKELLANALHGNRPGQFMGINCTSLPDTLLESELFGHAKGSFTGADKERAGAFEYTNNGTLFLDEIGDMGEVMQAKLLRVLETGEYRRLGENQIRKTNARIVSATNRMLYPPEQSDVVFREDLYWRLADFILNTKPLRARPNDIPLIAKEAYDFVPPKKDNTWFEGKDYSGNVRSLRQYIVQHQIFNDND